MVLRITITTTLSACEQHTAKDNPLHSLLLQNNKDNWIMRLREVYKIL